jgi:hypothetical protein
LTFSVAAEAVDIVAQQLVSAGLVNDPRQAVDAGPLSGTRT